MKEALNEEAERPSSEGIVKVIEATKELAKMASKEKVDPNDGREDSLEGLNLKDIKTEDKKYNFSDGIGKISADFAEKVASKCRLSSTPSAFQIRYAGYKGVVACDPKSSYKLSLRKESMCKYMSENTKLDVLAWSKYQPCFLNRQVITLVNSWG